MIIKVPGSSRVPVRDERTHPHRPRLVVYHSTCPPLSSSPPPANSFVIGPAVINTHTSVRDERTHPHSTKHTGLGSSSIIAHVLHSPPPPPANSFVIGPAVINTHLSICCIHMQQIKRRRVGTVRLNLGASVTGVTFVAFAWI